MKNRVGAREVEKDVENPAELRHRPTNAFIEATQSNLLIPREEYYAEVHFNFPRFLKELFYNHFVLFALPLMFYLQGFHGVKNRGFMSATVFPIQYFFWMTAVVYNVIFFWYFEEVSMDVSLFEVVILNMSWLFRNMVVASKYAHMSQLEYDEMDLPEPEIPQSHRQAVRQLISGWWRPSETTNAIEIFFAAHRNRINLENMDLTFEGCTMAFRQEAQSLQDPTGNKIFMPSSTTAVDSTEFEVLPYEQGSSTNSTELEQSKKSTAGDRERACGKERRGLPATIVLQRLVNDSVVKDLHISSIFCLVIVRTFLHIIVRAAFTDSVLGTTWQAMVINCLSVPATLLNFGSIIVFTAVGGADFFRRLRVRRALTDMLTTGYVIKESEMPLVLDTSEPSNVVALASCKDVLRAFGLSYYRRIQFLSALILAIIASLTGMVVIQLLFRGMDVVGLILVGYELALFSFFILLMMKVGSQINDSDRVHALALIRRKLALRSLDAPDMREEKRVIAENVLDSSAKEEELCSEVLPVRFLGIRADATLFRSVFTIVATGLAAIVREVALL